MIITAGRVVTPARVFAPGWLHVEGRQVVAVGGGEPPGPADVELAGTVAPGFIDVHVHGGGGASFDEGADAAERVLAAHLAHGTTSMVASLVTMEPHRLDHTIKELALLADDGRLAGIHLEGPWLSPRYRGAHRPDLLEEPSARRVDELVELAGPHLRMVTLAPELAGGLDAIRRLTSAGVVAAIGHTDATYGVARRALDAGALVGTHLFNAMRGLHHREPGPISALLEHPDAFVELIADGVHLHPAVLRLATHAKPHHSTLVTDAMAAATQPDGDYRLGSLAVQVRGGQARLPDGTIAGSTLTLADAVRYAVLEVGLPIEDAVRAATATPAAMLGLHGVGTLRPGSEADLVALDADLRVTRVMKAGIWL